MSLYLHRSETASGLVGGLADLVGDLPADPMTHEVIAVPTRGIERWLQQELSRLVQRNGLPAGITANVRFPSPRRLIDDVLIAAGHDERPWARDRLVWSVLAILDSVVDEPWMAVPRWFIAPGDTGGAPGRRSMAAAKIARLFARYDTESPDMIRAWANGSDVGPGGDPLGASHRWQPELWRRVRRHIGVPSLAESFDDLLAAIDENPESIDLPGRVSIYGLTAMPAGHLHVLSTVARDRDVHLFVLHPSDELWKRQATDAASPHNTLLESWARDVAGLQALVADLPITEEIAHPDPPPGTDALLHRLQRRIRADVPTGVEDLVVIADDASVRIHACHGAPRQAEVARDAILHALADDPTLQPRDVVIMCPDVETYAPLIEAAFHPDDRSASGIPDVRIRTADRAPTTNPMTALAVTLIELARSKVSATDVIELLTLEPVRTRFRLDDDAVVAVTGLIDDIGVSWGFDSDHRARHGLAGRPERTWTEGLQRLMTGVFVSDRVVGTIDGLMPAPGIEGGELDLAGRLAELVERLAWITDTMATPRPASEWDDLLMEAVGLIGGVGWDTEWQRGSTRRVLSEVFDGAAALGDPALDIDEVAALLAPLVEGRPSTVNHRTGDLTVCTLVPMRSVPHRVICLIGMDDDRFPRSPAPDGDDLLAISRVPGSRNPGAEDRQLLLDAVIAAADRLIVTYSGRDPRTNAQLPPATPIAELIEALDGIAVTADGAPISTQVVTHHPLQPFDPANFTTGAIVADRPWGFDPHMRAGAEALSAPGRATSRAMAADDWVPPAELSLDDLRAFLEHPVKAFLSARTGVRFPSRSDPRSDRLPIDLDGLGQWAVGDRLLRSELAGRDRRDLLEATRGSGGLPVGRLAEPALERVASGVDELLAAIAETGIDHTRRSTRRVDVTVGHHPRLTGVVTNVYGEAISVVHYSKVKPKHRLGLYLDLLVVTSAHPDIEWRASLVARKRRSGVYTMNLLSQGASASARKDWAEQRLDVLLDLFARGMAEPLPLFERCSFLIATGAPDTTIASEWQGDWGFDKEGEDPHHIEVFGEVPFDAVTEIEPVDTEAGGNWPRADSRVEVLAHRLWDPILELIEESNS